MGNDEDGPVLHEFSPNSSEPQFRSPNEEEVASSRIRTGAIFQQGSGNGEALALATRKLHSLLANHCVVPEREPHDEIMGISRLGCFHNLPRRSDCDFHSLMLFRTVSLKENCLLGDQCDLVSQRLDSHLPNVLAINEDLSIRDVIEARQRLTKGCLPRRHSFPRGRSLLPSSHGG